MERIAASAALPPEPGTLESRAFPADFEPSVAFSSVSLSYSPARPALRDVTFSIRYRVCVVRLHAHVLL